MPTQLPPLNKFRLVAQALPSGSTSVYKEEIDVSTIVLTSTVANITEDQHTFSMFVQKSGSATPVTILKNMILPPEETFTPIGGEGKLVLQQDDEIIFEVDTANVIEITLSLLENAND